MATDLSSALVEKERSATISELPGKASPTPSPGEGRLVSLDTFRGFIMFWIVGGREIIAAMLLAVKPNALSNALLYELSHSVWVGLHFWDCIWPSFMLMVGFSIPLSFAKRSRTQTYPQMLRHAVARAAILFLLGSLQESIANGAPYWLELSSVLQPIAIAYLMAFLLVRKSQWIQAAVGGAILAANALVLAFVPAPGVAAGSYLETSNIVRYLDLLVIGRTYSPGNLHGVGGTVWTLLPLASTTILGMLIGEWLMSAQSKESKAKMIAGAGVLCLATGYALSFVVPVIFKMTTASFVLVSTGWACLMFLLFYWTIDIRGHRKGTLPFVVIGGNAIFIYMFHDMVPLSHWVSIFTESMTGASPHLEHLLHALGVFAVEWLMLFWMYRNKIFVKA